MSQSSSPAHSIRRRRTLANIEVPSPISPPSIPDTKHETYASSTGLDEVAADKSPLSPRLSLRAEIEDRGKPPRGRRLDRTPPSEVRSKRRKTTRKTEFSQDKMAPPIDVSKRMRWQSVFLVWLAIVGAIVVAVWLRLASMPNDMDGAATMDAMDGDAGDGVPFIRMDSNDNYQKVPIDHVFGTPDRGGPLS